MPFQVLTLSLTIFPLLCWLVVDWSTISKGCRALLWCAVVDCCARKVVAEGERANFFPKTSGRSFSFLCI
ncbi:unnamed protein product [Amoebophrya sp. A25]|nr:unnamed protein product [Amoebophrya sp. A25]